MEHQENINSTAEPATKNFTMSESQLAVVFAIRRNLLLPLDDLLIVSNAFIHPGISRSDLAKRLKKQIASNQDDLHDEGESQTHGKQIFKSHDPGFLHISIEQLPESLNHESNSYLFIATDRATRWLHFETMSEVTPTIASSFLSRLTNLTPFTITRVLTKNLDAFTSQQSDSGHVFKTTCDQHDIRHYIAHTQQPQYSTLSKLQFDRSVFQGSTNFQASDGVDATLKRYTELYNEQIPQVSLGHKTPMQKLELCNEEVSKVLSKRSKFNFSMLQLAMIFCGWVAFTVLIASMPGW
jgi:hypothetical protein